MYLRSSGLVRRPPTARAVDPAEAARRAHRWNRLNLRWHFSFAAAFISSSVAIECWQLLFHREYEPPNPVVYEVALIAVMVNLIVTLLSGLLMGSRLLCDLEASPGVIALAGFADLHVLPFRRRRMLAGMDAALRDLAEDDRPILNRRQKSVLRRRLIDGNRDTVLAVLSALPKLGDPKALGPVRAVASARGYYRKDAEVLAAARNCLALLEADVARDLSHSTLVRPAGVPVEDVDNLLTPSARAGSEGEHLMRASVSPEQD